jgi:hypothetical protein
VTDASAGAPPAIVDVALGTLGSRRGSISFCRELPSDVTTLQSDWSTTRPAQQAAIRLRPQAPRL